MKRSSDQVRGIVRATLAGLAAVTPVQVSRVLAGGTQSPVLAWIDVAPAGTGQVVVTGHAHAAAAFEGRFTLSLTRTNAGNAAKTGQSGAVKVQPGESVTLSSTGINVAAGDRIKIELRIVAGDRTVATSVIETGAGP